MGAKTQIEWTDSTWNPSVGAAGQVKAAGTAGRRVDVGDAVPPHVNAANHSAAKTLLLTRWWRGRQDHPSAGCAPILHNAEER